MLVAITIGVGILLIVLETLLPGMIAGAIGTVLMGTGVYFSYRNYGTETGIWVLIVSIIILMIALALWFRFIPKSPFIQKFISDRSIHGDAGEELPSNLVGQTGTAETRLYSCGKIRVGNKILDAITAGEGIEKGAPVKIVHVEGIKIVVQEILKS
ncbi:MAG: hypothetical protein IKQ24_01730 [Verrucomicrobia bacterium]|nr:hypothetical protein [Verrucomicrobiota bacterium]